MSKLQQGAISENFSSLRHGLVGEYLFNGSAEDTSGHGHHGRVEGATLTANRFGEADRAYAFSGQGDHIVVDQPPALHADAFSISVWVKYDQGATMEWWNNAIISQDDNGVQSDQSRRVFQLSTKGQFVTLHLMMKAPDASCKLPVQRGEWYHIATVYDGVHHKLYMNGELQDAQGGAFRPNAEEPIFFGKKNSDEPRFWFHGSLDEIRIYNRVLSEEEILGLFAENGYKGNPELPATLRREDPVIRPGSNKKTLKLQWFNWNDCYNSLALALYGAMLYSNKPISLTQALVYTGQAFTINTDMNVMPMDVFGDGSRLGAALNNLGFEMEVLSANLYGGDWEEDTVNKALDMVRESIDRGIAVVGWNLDNYEHGLIYGYDDERRILNVHDINARNGGELSYDDFGRRSRNGESIPPEMFVLVLKERNETPHLNVTRYSEEEDASYRKTLCAALSLAICHIDDEGEDSDQRKNGIAAIDAWISAFEAGTAHRFFTGYNLLWITSVRQYLVPFFSQSAITYCMAVQDTVLQQLMLKAADAYLSSFGAWVRLRELFPFPADTTDPELKTEAIRLLYEAREAEKAGSAVLHKIVGHLSKE
ncbi:MAG: LamG domain-containing protein [Bacillota bacterium]